MPKSIFLQIEDPTERSRLIKKVIAAGYQEPNTIAMLAFVVFLVVRQLCCPSLLNG